MKEASLADKWDSGTRLLEVVYLIVFDILLILKCSFTSICECLSKDISSDDSLASSCVPWKWSSNLDWKKKGK